ncbi:2200_t:CDS:2 [Ambispora gerdemannii]|uniref:2200_t:CDS:1 n=1 Tax=Ambispora gerdemannii TaxID=144530 RepID=A0A9N9GT48_9GLOM|nr:2200_t:CDS:2 [Ambispora gerdemannii]
MTAKEIKKVNTVSTPSPTVAAPTNQQQQAVELNCQRCQRKVELIKTPSQPDKDLITIKGTLTSQIQLRGESTKEPYYYTFIRLKSQSIDLPVIFKITEQDNKLIEPKLKKGSEIQLSGHYSNSEKNVRKSFTAYSYQICNEKRIKKKCFGCGDTFTCSQPENYDYCSNCELNSNRYISKDNKCSECNGLGIIKFPNQPPRPCKTCHLAQVANLEQAKSQSPKLAAKAEQIIELHKQLEKEPLLS